MVYEVKTFKLTPKLPNNSTSSVLRSSQVNLDLQVWVGSMRKPGLVN